MMAVCAVFTGCKDKDDKVDYSGAILGTWIAVSEDGNEILTDDVFINVFTQGMKTRYASMLPVENGIEWTIEPEGNYSLNDDILYEWGVDEDGKSYSYKSSIAFVGGKLVLQMLEAGYDDEMTVENTIYVLRKVTRDYSSQFTGVWKGYETSEGVSAPEAGTETYWEYKTDGMYEYYSWDETEEKYVKKTDNDGYYFLYEDLLATNYTNDLNTGEQGRTSENWWITIQGNTMTWRGLREDGAVKTFRMEKVASPPSIE